MINIDGKVKNKNRHSTSKKTYTKKIMSCIIIIALIDMQFPFILAFLGKDTIAETMGTVVVTEIVGVFLVYCAKSYFETKEQEKVRLSEQVMKDDEDEMEDENYG